MNQTLFIINNSNSLSSYDKYHTRIIQDEPTKDKNGANSKISDSNVYMKSKEHEWVPVTLLETDGTSYATVSVQQFNDEEEMLSMKSKRGGYLRKKEITIELKDYENNILPLQNVNDNTGRLLDYADMVNLPFLHEAAILYNLKSRHAKEKPYTRTGDIIVAMNPYKWYPKLYSDQMRNMYSQKLVWERPENDPRTTLEPHVYEVSALSYRGLAIEDENQSILVSGESGAGKTETVKICMNHVASVQRGLKDENGTAAAQIIQKVIDSNPLLEAFGNAKTRRNDNSSRFGKFLQLQFDKTNSKTTTLAGSKCEVYLLEKNRVISHDEEERTFHIFYQLLAAKESEKQKIWSGLSQSNNDSFAYVGHTKTNTIEGISDGERFELTKKTLDLIGVKGETFKTLMQAMCIVLQLGNITFGSDNGDDDVSNIKSQAELACLSELMGISTKDLTKALTERIMKTKNEKYSVPLNSDIAKESTNAFSRELYGRLFLWLVRAINDATCAESNYGEGRTKEFGTIGLLDIFGFESFDVNRFEQLCINYANEKLQHKFTEDIFCSVQEEYEYEGIPLAEITYDDNTPVVELIESRGGLLSILNDECLRPKGNDAAFVCKSLSQLKKKSCLIPNKIDRLSFGIQHFAGEVMYNANDFVTKNQDTLPSNLLQCGTNCSKNSIVSSLFKAVPEKKNERRKRARSTIAGDTIWTKYKDQLSALMKSIRKTQTRYIRCIKPNSTKKPLIVEHKIAVEQLRTAGIIAGITISRSAFPNRLENIIVNNRYSGMWDKKKYPSTSSYFTGNDYDALENLEDDCLAMLTGLLKIKEIDGVMQFAVGRTRTYFRSGALEYLESIRQKGLDMQAIHIQRIIRGWFARKINGELRKHQKMELLKKKKSEQAKRQRKENEKQARTKKREEILQNFREQINNLQKQIIDVDVEKEESLLSLKNHSVAAKKKQDDLKNKIKESIKDVMLEKEMVIKKEERIVGNKLLMQQLKRDHKRFGKVHGKTQKQHKRMSLNNQKIDCSARRSSLTFSENFPDASEIMSKYDNLKDEEEIETIKYASKESEVALWQDRYWAKASIRLEAQQGLGNMLTIIQEESKNTTKNKKIRKMAEKTAHDCQEKSNLIMEKLDSEFGDDEDTKLIDLTKDPAYDTELGYSHTVI